MDHPTLIDPMIGGAPSGSMPLPTLTTDSVQIPPSAQPKSGVNKQHWRQRKPPQTKVTVVKPAPTQPILNYQPNTTIQDKGKPTGIATIVEQIPKLKLSNTTNQPVPSHVYHQNVGFSFPSTAPSNWRETHQSLAQANKFLLNCGPLLQKYSDCTFIIGNGRELFEAHRLILVTRSDVLERMLDLQSSIEIPEVSSGSFREFLHFVYTDEFIVSSDNVTEVFHLAHKFNIPLLKQKCSVQIAGRICLENCVDVYQTFGRRYDPNGLGKQAFDFMIRNIVRLLKRVEFLQLDLQSLQEILVRDNLCVDEIEIFEAVVRWADQKCVLNGWQRTPENKRKAMSSIIKLIRFPVMIASVFASRVAPLQILSPEESMKIFMYLNGTGQQKKTMSVEPFNKAPRNQLGNLNTRSYVPRHF